jgi:penicillin-binding protein 2
VQLAIGQGLLSASPMHLANGYSTIANQGFLMKPEIIKAVYEPGVPDSVTQGYVDLTNARLARPANIGGEVVRTLPLPQEAWTAIGTGLRRVITGPGQVVGSEYRSTTGEKLFETYPAEAIPVAGKTGTAQGAGNYPWNDSSAFAAYSLDPERPYTVAAYLEKSGYGSQAAAPVVKCLFQQMSGVTPADPVVLAEPLDTSSNQAAPARGIADPSCFAGRFDSGAAVTE